MIRVSMRVAAVTFLVIGCLWLAREVYEPGHQYRFPWITATVAGILVGASRGLWYRRRHPPVRRRMRLGDPGE